MVAGIHTGNRTKKTWKSFLFEVKVVILQPQKRIISNLTLHRYVFNA